MSEELETVLRLVADGRLTPEEAAPIIDALARAGASRGHVPPPSAAPASASAAGDDVERPAGAGHHLRVRVTEHGRQVVNLRIPIGFVDAALDIVPGLGEHGERIRQAVSAGALGPILDVEDPGGDGVLITVE